MKKKEYYMDDIPERIGVKIRPEDKYFNKSA